MPNRRKPEFNMSPDLEKFKYEVAEEISINNRKHRGAGGIASTSAGATTKNIGATNQQQ